MAQPNTKPAASDVRYRENVCILMGDLSACFTDVISFFLEPILMLPLLSRSDHLHCAVAML